MQELTILCKVVDNYGDAGVVYRLYRSLHEIEPDMRINIIIDDFASFAKLAPDAQNLNIFLWNDKDSNNDEAKKYYQKNHPSCIIECFACGRPEWLEEILFSKESPKSLIVNLEYLTAEDYAEDFHCLQSLTRSAKVQKFNFLPGFTNKTGGLILDKSFVKSLSIQNNNKSTFNIPIFTYERNFDDENQALSKFNKQKKICIQLTEGKSREPFLTSWQKYEEPFKVNLLDFVSQVEWDSILCNADFLFVRGEDSLSRACLIGKPFVWHAYPQSENYQLVKVQALLKLMENDFDKSDFQVLQQYWINYNSPKELRKGNQIEFLSYILDNYEKYSVGFKKFAEKIKKNGNLSLNLLTFISKIE